MPYAPPRHNANKTKSNRKKQQQHYNKHIRKNQEFYNSGAWRKVRNWFIKANPICVMCKAKSKTTSAQVVDHIIEIKDGGAPLDASNLQSLCNACHNTKTAKNNAQG